MELQSIGIIGASFATMPADRGAIFVTNISLEDLVLRRRVEICFSTHIRNFEYWIITVNVVMVDGIIDTDALKEALLYFAALALPFTVSFIKIDIAV
jgi:hypothetical protein